MPFKLILSLCHHPTKYVNMPCFSRDIMGLACHLILQDHVIKGSGKSMGKSLTWQAIILPSLVSMGIVAFEI